ncbi:MAG: MATE family efflux transporter [Rhodobacteraceae bacterium]|nr:MATE family efflux transporter [Paracoccaceae bacterium]
MTAAPSYSAKTAEITSQRVLLIAAPVVLSNATVPLQGFIDTAIIGNLGEVAPLAAVGIGAQVLSFAFGIFNFLQIGVSGLSAQALGAGLRERVVNTLLRGLLIALTIACLLILLQLPLRWLGLSVFEASEEAETLAAVYIGIRIWGAPAELMNYALVGWFAGQEMTRRMFQHQVALSLANIALNFLLAVGLGWGIVGVALGTVIASYLGLAYGLWLARGRLITLLPEEWRPDPARVLRRDELIRMMALNRDIFIRTILLISGFLWVARLGSLQGDAILAANVVLLQFFMISAYALDGFAIAAETLVGQALGARDPRRLDAAALATSLWSGALAVVIALSFVAGSHWIIDVVTTAEPARTLAKQYVLWTALIPLVGFAAFQLDGIFIGATASVEMRNAMILTSLFFFPGGYWMTLTWGNHGLWASVWLWLLLRAGTLLALYPRIRARACAPQESGRDS